MVKKYPGLGIKPESPRHLHVEMLYLRHIYIRADSSAMFAPSIPLLDRRKEIGVAPEKYLKYVYDLNRQRKLTLKYRDIPLLIGNFSFLKISNSWYLCIVYIIAYFSNVRIQNVTIECFIYNVLLNEIYLAI